MKNDFLKVRKTKNKEIESGKLTEERWKIYMMLKGEGHWEKKPSSPREQPASKISGKQQRKREKRIDGSED